MFVWNVLLVDMQEMIFGCLKVDNIELDDVVEGYQQLYKSFVIIEDDDGIEYDIIRDNMLFGSFGVGEFGMYFFGYFCYLWVIQWMFECMFIGELVGMYDWLFDFFIVFIGLVFFVLFVGEFVLVYVLEVSCIVL